MAHPVTAQDDAISKALEDVTAAADRYSKLSAQSVAQNGVVRDGVNSAGRLTVSHNQLFVKAMQLVRTIRGPVDMLFAHFENVSCVVSLSIVGSIETPLPLPFFPRWTSARFKAWHTGVECYSSLEAFVAST